MSQLSYSPQKIAERIARGIWCDHDPSVIAEVFTDDAVYTDVAFELSFSGHAGIGAYLARVISVIPDFQENLITAIDVRPGTIAAHWTFAGTCILPSEPKTFCLPGVSIITMEGDKVKSNVDYYSAAAFLEAMGREYPTIEAFKNRQPA